MTAVPLRRWLSNGLSEPRRRWAAASPRARFAIQIAALLAAVIGAYNYSLITLVQNVGLETPLAYVSLVPLISLGLAAILGQARRDEPLIHDRQADYCVGLPLIAVAMLMNFLLPEHYSVMFWVWRLDLLSLPLFIAGCVAIIFGTRVLFRQAIPLIYLIAAWPWPWSAPALPLLNGFTDVTLDALHALVSVVGVATVVPGTGGSIFGVTHGHGQFQLSVVSACSGVNGVVGFVLVGVAFLLIVRGPRLRKWLWIVGGMLLCWCMNLARLTFIFWAGRVWGEHVAIDILHPFIGLVTFGLGVAVMMLLLRPIGLTIFDPTALAAPIVRARRPASPSGGAYQNGGLARAAALSNGGQGPNGFPLAAGAPGAGAWPASRPTPIRRSPTASRGPRVIAVPGVILAVLIVFAAAVVTGIDDYNLRVYNLVANSGGEPTLTALTGLDSRLASPEGWSGSMVAQYTWATPFFGDNSTWYRYYYVSDPGAVPYSNQPVTVDVINTTDLASFSAYGIPECYAFHGYQLRDISDVNLGGGVVGQTMSYSGTAAGSWSIVYWIVPVKNGTATHYERVVVYLDNLSAPQVRFPSNTPGATNVEGSLTSLGQEGTVLYRNREFLIAFANAFLRSQAHKSSHLTSVSAGSTA
ncbi:MAG TPA: archaeosortase/exosortase family protein [Acidimicrobiales bacterium]|nr:archaeosortase/exosortase family protein [Acidimicrobiales bacterium]